MKKRLGSFKRGGCNAFAHIYRKYTPDPFPKDLWLFVRVTCVEKKEKNRPSDDYLDVKIEMILTHDLKHNLALQLKWGTIEGR